MTGEFSVEFCTNHLLSITGHNTTTWSKVDRIVYQRSLDQRNVRSINCTCFKEVCSTESDKNATTCHVWVLVNLETLVQCTNLGNTHCELRLISVCVELRILGYFQEQLQLVENKPRSLHHHEESTDELCYSP